MAASVTPTVVGTTVTIVATGLTGTEAELVITMPGTNGVHRHTVPIVAGALAAKTIANAKSGSHRVDVLVGGTQVATANFSV